MCYLYTPLPVVINLSGTSGKSNMNRLSGILMIMCSVMFLSCMRNRHDYVLCTTEYRMLTVTIRDSQSNPVILSNYFVKKSSTGEIIDFSLEDPYLDSINRLQGIYFLCTDGMMDITSKNGTGFEFHGISDSSEIVNEKYLIGNDECHVFILSGQTNIVITK
jgi:hypothetical protein